MKKTCSSCPSTTRTALRLISAPGDGREPALHAPAQKIRMATRPPARPRLRLGRGARPAADRRRPRPRQRHRHRRRYRLATRARSALPLRRNAGPAAGPAGNQSRPRAAATDGPPALRRCRLRQDRSGPARRFQGGHGWPAGRAIGTDHRARPATRADFPLSPRAISRAGGDALPLSRTAKRKSGGCANCRMARSISSSARTACSRPMWNSRAWGLLIIDDEQRFGVRHKEHFKRLRARLDVLTMTATPIPRTLFLALSGVRDISQMRSPPEERLPVLTHTGPYEESLARRAILREIERGGQIFYIHNRVRTIEAARERLAELAPEARITVAHGQLPQAQLASLMAAFARGESDLLLATTIIEAGLDIPSANTLIVERADRFGLAQLYQLRGRVGPQPAAGLRLFLPPGASAPAPRRARAPAHHRRTQRAGQRLAGGPARPGAARRAAASSPPARAVMSRPSACTSIRACWPSRCARGAMRTGMPMRQPAAKRRTAAKRRPSSSICRCPPFCPRNTCRRSSSDWRSTAALAI